MPNKLVKMLTGNFYAFLSACFVSGYFIVNRYVYIHYRPSAISYVSTFMAGAGLIALVSFVTQRARNRNNERVDNPRGIIWMALIATLAIGMTVFGQKYTVASNAAVLATLAIVTTIYFSHVMLKQTVQRAKLGWVLLLIAGVYLAIIGFSGYHPRLGDWVIIASSIFFGLSNTMSRPLLAHNSPSTVRDVRFMTGGTVFALIILVVPSVTVVTNAGLYPLLASLFFWLAIYCYYKAVPQIGPAHAIVINNAHPVLTVLGSIVLLSEHVTAMKIVGTVLVMVAIYQVSQNNSSAQKR